MKTIGRQLIADRKKDILYRKGGVDSFLQHDAKDSYATQGKDLLSVLINANMDADVPESQRLSDDDVLARTFCSCTRYW